MANALSPRASGPAGRGAPAPAGGRASAFSPRGGLSEEDKNKLSNIGKKKYAEQAIWFLNAWSTSLSEQEKEHCYLSFQKFSTLDDKLKKGEELVEFDFERLAHFFLAQMEMNWTNSFPTSCWKDLTAL